MILYVVRSREGDTNETRTETRRKAPGHGRRLEWGWSGMLQLEQRHNNTLSSQPEDVPTVESFLSVLVSPAPAHARTFCAPPPHLFF